MQNRTGGGLTSPTFILGTDTQRGTRITTPLADLMTGMYVIGATGSGKTTFLLNLILQAIEQGIGLAFLSPHADAIADVIARLPAGREQAVILLDVLSSDASFGLNLFQCDTTNEREVSITAQVVLELFAKLFTETGDLAASAPTMYESLLALTMLLIHNQSHTLAEAPMLFTNKEAALSLARKLPESQADIRRWWEAYYALKEADREYKTGSLQRRLLAFLSDTVSRRIFGSPQTTINLRSIMDSRKVLLVKLDRQRPQLTSLVGATLVSLIAAAAYSRADVPEEKRVTFCLFADEYQRFSTPTFAELLTEVRKFRIATTIAHQFRDQLDMANKGATLNAGNLVVFHISGKDGEELAKQFRAAHVEPEREQGVLAGNMAQVLGREGHPDERARAFVQVYLRFLQTAAREEAEEIRERSMPRMTVYPTIQVTSPDVLGSFEFEYNPDEVKQGIQYLNDWLYNCVRDLQASADPDREMLRCFSHVLGFSNYWTIIHTLPTPLIKQTLFEMVKAGTPGQKNEAWKKALRDFDSAHVLYIKDLLQEQRSRGEYPTVQASRTGWIYKGDSSRSDKTSPDASTIALAAYTLEKERYHTFVESLALLLAALREQPIFSDSRKYGLAPSASPRQIADLEREIAQELVHPDKYCARVRLGTAEYTIQALPLPAPSRSVAALVKEIREHNLRCGYLQKKDMVDAQIKKRQQQLTTATSLLAVPERGLLVPSAPTDASLSLLPEGEQEQAPLPYHTQGTYVPSPNGYLWQVTPPSGDEAQPIRYIPTPNGYLPVFTQQSTQPAAPGAQQPGAKTPPLPKQPKQPQPKKQPAKKRTRQEEDEDR